MTKTILSSTALAIGMALPAAALAQSAPASSCPPGAWFCAEPPEEHLAPAGKAVQGLQPLPDPQDSDEAPAEPPPPPPPRRHRRPPPPPPPADYTAPPAVVVRPEIPPPPPYDLPPPPPPEPISRAHEWGLNLHLDGATFGHGAGHAGMGGAGAGLRFKPNRRFGIETDVDITGGTDYQGASRTETAFTINGLLFLNPRSRAQFYILAGFGWSGANVSGGSTNGSYGSGSGGGQYTYFGGQLGGGLELRLCRALALNADVRGFIRTRVDSAAQSQPEFVDAYGRSTNTSGGALFTGGMTIYF